MSTGVSKLFGTIVTNICRVGRRLALLRGELERIRTLSEQAQLLSRPARQLFRIILNRRNTHQRRYGAQELRVDVSLLRDVTGLDQQVLTNSSTSSNRAVLLWWCTTKTALLPTSKPTP